MDVNLISGASQNTQAVNNQNHQGNQNQGNNPAQTPPAAPNIDEAAVYEPGVSQTYTPDTGRIQQMWAEHDAKVESFRRLVETLFNKQGQTFNLASGGLRQALENIQVDDETRAAAQAEIGEGGYYSVEETAKRILNFAVALSGGDPSKVDMLERAAMRGFAEAEKMWGGKLPEISQQTMEAVRNGFEQWRQAGSASAITLLQ
jgi:hypothetical protein